MFHFDGGIKLTRCGLALDDRRRQPRAFVSHAHADHIGRHVWALATPATLALYRHRLGNRLRVRELPYFEPYQLGNTTLTTYPAGHCLGSAMLLADDGHQRLLYTGDFKLGESLTAHRAELPEADILIMESTFGQPRYRMPPRQEVIDQLLTTIRATLADGRTPLIHAYALGKSQEVAALLAQASIPAVQHPAIAAVSEVYQQCGIDLGTVRTFTDRVPPGHAVITLPKSSRGFHLPEVSHPFSIAVTGWAMHPSTRYRLGVDLALPLSDHADFDELVETVRRVAPREIYCTHGPREFAGHLRDAGFNAQPLVPEAQRWLF